MAGRRRRMARGTTTAIAVLVGALLTACTDDGEATSPVPSTSPIGTASTTTSMPVAPDTTSTLPPAAPTTVPGASARSGASPPPAVAPAGSVVVIDPGHNGANGSHPTEINRLVDAGGFQKACNTTGAAEGGLSESRFNWELALIVRSRLEQAGVQVLLTRSDDEGWGPCIDERGQTAARASADALVSLHADGAAAGAHGFHVIHPTVVAGYTDATAAPSRALAVDLRDALVGSDFTSSTYVGGDGVVARSDLGTLNRAEVPAAMVEVGNMHHPGDFEMMTSAADRERLADALAAGVIDFLAAQDAGSVAPMPSG